MFCWSWVGVWRPVSNFSIAVRGKPRAAARAGRLRPLAVRSSSMRCAKVTIKICLLAECLLYPVPAALSMRRDFSFGCGCDMIAVQRRS